jgi:tRNA(Ile)-lysidine synthase
VDHPRGRSVAGLTIERGMSELAAPVAAVRNAVRQALRSADIGPEALVMVACSGGPDSLALAAAAAFVAPRLGLRAGLVTIDHGLQAGSAERADDVVAWAKSAVLSPALKVSVDVTPRGDGPEAAARSARYAALAEAARRERAPIVLLGHTREDQAETVLLALARGAGARGLSGMPVRRDIGGVAFLRPLLDVARADTADACVELGLVPWTDPHNDDPRFARSRVRSALPLLSELLGSGVVANLARTARLVAADTAALDGWAAAAEVTARVDDTLDVAAVAAMPAAIRTRVLRTFALRLGAPAGALAATHIDALDALVTTWRGQGPVALPGGILVGRQAGRLRIAHGKGVPTYSDGSRGASSSSVPAMAAKLLADSDME